MHSNNQHMYPNLPPIDPLTGQPQNNPVAFPPDQPYPQQGLYPFFPQPGYRGQQGPSPGMPGAQIQIQPTPVALAYPAHPAYPNVTPTMIPAGVVPSAPPAYGFTPTTVAGLPTVTPTPYLPESAIEWVPTHPKDAAVLAEKVVVAGFEAHDNSPLWIIRAKFEGDLIPGKLAIKHKAAYVPWGGNENCVQNIEVLCASPERVKWITSRDGQVPPNAVVGGRTKEGEPLFVGRVREQGSLTPGKIHPSHNAMYISFAGKEVAHKVYEVLCQI